MKYLQSLFSVVLLAAVATLVGCGGGGGGGSAGEAVPPADRFVVSGNNGGTLSVLRVDPVAGFAHAVTYLKVSNFGVNDMVYDQSNSRLLIMTSNEVQTLNFNPATGKLVSNDISTTSSNSSHMAYNPGRSSVYIASGNSTGFIDSFTIDASGALSTRDSTNLTIDPDYLALNPTATKLYVLSRSDNQIHMFNINPDGSLAAGPTPIFTDVNPTALAFNAAGTVAYLTRADNSQDSLQVMDVAANGNLSLRSSFDVDASAQDLVLSSNGQNLYVIESGSDQVHHYSVNDNGDLGFVTTLNLSFQPTDLALSMTGAELYISHSNDDLLSTLAVDPNDGSLSIRGWARVFDDAFSVAAIGGNGALTPRATFLLAPDQTGLSRYAIDGNGMLSLAGKISQPSALINGEVAVNYYDNLLLSTGENSADADLVNSYSFNPLSGSTSLVSSNDFTVSSQSDFQRIELGRSGRYAYVLDEDILDSINNERGFVRVYEYSANGSINPTVRDVETADQAPENMSLHPAGRFLYVINSLRDTISRFSVNPSDGRLTFNGTNTPGNTGAGFGRPIDMVFHPNGRWAYVSLEDDSRVVRYIVDPNGSLSNIARLTLPQSNGFDVDPGPMAAHPSGKYVIVGERNDQENLTVMNINQTNGTLTFNSRLPLAGNPTWIAINPQGNMVYVRDRDENIRVFRFDASSGTLTNTGQVVDAGDNGGFLGTLTLVSPLQ